jgi:predicted phage tail protein
MSITWRWAQGNKTTFKQLTGGIKMFNKKLKLRVKDLEESIESLGDEKLKLKEEVADLKLKKKIEDEDIKHMVKIEREKLAIEQQKKELEL